MSIEEAHAAIRKTIERHGRFILGNITQPFIGEVQMWADLPMRVVRFVTHEEAYAERCPDIWGEEWEYTEEYYFEVEVAD